MPVPPAAEELIVSVVPEAEVVIGPEPNISNVEPCCTLPVPELPVKSKSTAST